MSAISSLNESSSHNKKVNPKIIETQIASSTIDAWTMYIYLLKFYYTSRNIQRGWLNFLGLEVSLRYSNEREVEDVCCKSNSYIIKGCEPGLQ
jgi:hypothetical protein